MSFSTTATEIFYNGNGTDTTFSIPFYFHTGDSSTIKIQIWDLTDPDVPVEVLPQTLGTTYKVTTGPNQVELIEFILGVETPLPLPATHRIRVYRDSVSYHQIPYSSYQFPYPAVNIDFDRVYQLIQELKTDIGRAVMFSPVTVSQGVSLTAEDTKARIESLEDRMDTAEDDIDVLQDIAAQHLDRLDDIDALDIDQTNRIEDLEFNFSQLTGGTGSFGSTGFSARFNESFDTADVGATIAQILQITYLGPTVSLSGSISTGVREKGTVVPDVTLTANTTKRSNDITEVRFYRAGALISTDATPSADGSADSTFTDTTDFSDTISFTAQVDDGTSTGTSNTLTYSFVYPYYYGAGAPGLTAAAVAALTKYVISSSSSVNPTFTTSNGDVYYFAYPATYGGLSSILDENGFETFNTWTLRTENITGLDGSAQSYRIYVFNNQVIAGTTNFRFIR